MNVYEKARQDYAECKNIFEGRDFLDIPNIVSEQHLSYGALTPQMDYKLVDVNFKSILVTIMSIHGKCVLCKDIEVYLDGGEFVDVLSIEQ